MAIRFVRARGTKSEIVALSEGLRSLNLLGHAQLTETDIGSSCGGHGICGGDRIRPVCPAGWLSPLTAAERDHLGEEMLREGWRLGCQAYPERDGLDFEIEIPGIPLKKS